MNKIFKNFLSNLLRAIIVVPIYFLITPYIIYKIGVDGYGVWALIAVIGNYQLFVDMGISTALIRYVAIARSENNRPIINEYLAVGLLVFIAIPAVFLVMVFFAKDFIVVSILGITSNRMIAESLVVYTVAAIFFNLISTLLRAVIDGFQRMDISNGVLVFQNLGSALGTFFFLYYGYGILGMGINLLLISVLTSGVSFIAAKIVFKELRLSLFLFQLKRFKEIFKYSINLQLSGVSRALVVSVNKIVIAHFFSVNEVTYYELAYRLLNQFESLINSGLSSLFPVGTELFHEKGAKGIDELRKKSLKYVFPLFTLIYLFIFLATPGFVQLWLGSEFKITATIIRIFLVANYLVSLAMPAYIFLNGAGFSKDTLSLQLKSMAFEVVLLFVLVYLGGFLGFCAAYSLSLIFAFYLTHSIYKKRFSIHENVYSPFLNLSLLGFCSFVVVIGFTWTDKLVFSNYFELILYSVIWWFISLLFVALTKILTKEDILLLVRKPVSQSNQLL